jgi:hypothetical protein
MWCHFPWCHLRSRHVRSHATFSHEQWYIVYYYYSKKKSAGMRFWACVEHTSGYVWSGQELFRPSYIFHGLFIGCPPNPNIKVVYRDSSRHISVGAKESGPLRNIKDGKVFAHLGFRSKVLPESLTDLSA